MGFKGMIIVLCSLRKFMRPIFYNARYLLIWHFCLAT